MKTVTCTALTFFLDFVPDHGMVHGDPKSDDKAARFPEVPESYVDTLVDAGKIKVGSPKGKRGKGEAEPADEPATAGDEETATEDAAPL
jgi:hypothetical protein